MTFQGKTGLYYLYVTFLSATQKGNQKKSPLAKQKLKSLFPLRSAKTHTTFSVKLNSSILQTVSAFMLSLQKRFLNVSTSNAG